VLEDVLQEIINQYKCVIFKNVYFATVA